MKPLKSTLGIGGSIHDFTACHVASDRTISAAEVERYSRRRYALAEPTEHMFAVEALKRRVGSDVIAAARVYGDDMISDRFFPGRTKLNHHVAHIYSAFFTSTFERSAILVVDGVGSSASAHDPEIRESTTYASGEGNTISIHGKVFCHPGGYRHHAASPRIRHNSLGDLYRLVTESIGFGYLQAGKTMGLYPYGSSRYAGQFLDYVDLQTSGGGFSIDMSEQDGLPAFIQRLRKDIPEDRLASFYADLAYAAQSTTEAVLWHCLRHLHQVTGSRNLCLVGGVALNCAANGRISQNSEFERIHVISAPGDNGAALGAAIYGAMDGYGSDLVRLTSPTFTGASYDDLAILSALAAAGMQYEKVQSPDAIAKIIATGQIVAIYRGPAEFGPRALGNRSLLADPRERKMVGRINELKGREWFRPVAPAVLSESSHEYFASDCTSPEMQFTALATERTCQAAPACVHIDGSARLQTVDKTSRPWLHGLIDAFRTITGVPILLNTSFNVRGEPIVETPEEAIEAFKGSDIQALVIGDYLVTKK